MDIFMRRASKEDALHVATNLRAADRAEVLAQTALPAEIVLVDYVTRGQEVWAGGLEGGPAEILFGCDPVYRCPDMGVVWLLGTDAIKRHPKAFHQTALQVLEAYRARYSILTNFVDARNTLHIRWLRRLGFVMLRRIEKFGAQSLPFIEFALATP